MSPLTSLSPDADVGFNGSTQIPREDSRDEALALVEISVQAVILIVALLGNSFVLLALMRQRRFRPNSRIYLFMLHLSVADLLVAFLNILPQMLWDITYRFQGGDGLCRAVKYCQVMVLYLSTYILVMMAVDRLRAVCWGVSLHSSSMRLAKLMILGTWVFAMVAAVPQAVIFRRKEVRPGVWDCWGDFPEGWGLKAYVTWFVISIFIIPLFVIAICYGIICYRVWSYDSEYHAAKEKSRNRSDVYQNSHADTLPLRPLTPASARLEQSYFRTNGRNVINKAKMKTIKLTLIVVICFFICWSPFCITQLILTYNPPKSVFEVGPVQVICLLLASLNSCTNPWIYLAFSGTLLNQLRVCLGLGTGRSHDNVSIGDEEPDQKPAQNGGGKTKASRIKGGPDGMIAIGKANHNAIRLAMEPSNKIPSTNSEMV